MMHTGGAETRTTTPSERREYGAIVTFETAGGARFSLHRRGLPLTALRNAIADALWFDDSARVETICTPDTIYSDLRGRPIQHDRAQSVESSMLGRIGRRDLLSRSQRLYEHERYTR
jgi:hypothetical protein